MLMVCYNDNNPCDRGIVFGGAQYSLILKLRLK